MTKEEWDGLSQEQKQQLAQVQAESKKYNKIVCKVVHVRAPPSSFSGVFAQRALYFLLVCLFSLSSVDTVFL